jgi:hypothetical protein
MTRRCPRGIGPKRFVAVVALLVLTGCSGDSDGTAPPAPAASDLPVGKSDLVLDAGTYASPAGFRPALVHEVPDGWQSVHRGADAFDLGKPDPALDAPLVAVVLMRPVEATAEEALAAVRERAGAHATEVDGAIGEMPADGLDIDGGTGQLVASASGGIALDAAPGQRMRVLAADVGGDPLLVVVLVPHADRWDDAWAEAATVLDGIDLK